MSTLSSASRARSTSGGRSYATRAWLLCSVTLLLVVAAERWLLAQHVFPGDRWAAGLGTAHKPWVVYAITRVYQQVGRPLVAVGEVLVMVVWLWRSAGRRAAQGLLIGLLASATCGLIKIICGPTALWMTLSHHIGTNFPSGVVTFMTATVGYVGVVAWRQGRRIPPILLLVAILGAGPARVLGGQHLLSDVLGAYTLGVAWLIVAWLYLVGAGDRPEPGPSWLHHWTRRDLIAESEGSPAA